MTKRKNIFSHTPQCSLNAESRGVPWSTLFVVVLLVIFILVLWGQVARRMRLPHEVPLGNAPGLLLPL